MKGVLKKRETSREINEKDTNNKQENRTAG